ncbi:hypothetical protein SKAU_G00361280 [Synaphobranchus kaupii]|uniref:Uncharacterized protein n=1 Tax=Synaphobranchus kaupii TaxID=118154 RepID=A0A9Q1EIC7_SYNKA|nr:hypothetical protein SKAU_G00361280 [Synaphobranchus kaupii]
MSVLVTSPPPPYAFRFRHSPNCWYLRDWTIHSWFQKCLKYGARDKALHTLKHKWQEERSMGAALLIAGLRQDNSAGRSAQLLGSALLGKVEMSRGIHAVFQQMPLIWTPGYLSRALAVMENVCSGTEGVKLSKDALDCLEGVLRDSGPECEVDATRGDEDTQGVPGTGTDEEDQLEKEKLPEYVGRFQDLSSKLQSLGRVDTGGLLALVSALADADLGAVEGADGELYATKVQEWEQERQMLVQREKELRERAQQEHLAREAAKAAKASA